MSKKQNLEATYLELAEVMLVALDAKGTVTMVNRKTCAVLGLDKPQILGKDWIGLFIPEASRGEMREVFKRLIIGELGELEYFENPVLTAAGEERVIAWHNTYLKEDGRIVGILSAGQDITQRLRVGRKLRESLKELRFSHCRLLETQEQLVQSAKLETVGRLAKGVAHEIKNPLAILLQGTDYLRNNLRLRDTDAEVVVAMRESIERADAVVQKLLLYAAEKDLNLTWEDSARMVQEALQRVNYDLVKNNIRLQAHYQADLPRVYVDREQINQALTDIFVNALRSMPRGGALSVRVEESELAA